MASQTIGTHLPAEVAKRNKDDKKRAIELLEELGLPKGLFPLDDIEDFRYNHVNGFLHKKKEHTFRKIKRTVSYATEMMALVKKGKLRKIARVKTKELMMWLSVVEVYVEKSSCGKIAIKTSTGLSDSFNASVFELGM